MPKLKKRWVFHDGYIAPAATGSPYHTPVEPVGIPGNQEGCQGRWETADLGPQVCPHCGDTVTPTVFMPLEDD